MTIRKLTNPPVPTPVLDRQAIAGRIRLFRVARGMSRADLSRVSGINYQTLVGYERVRRPRMPRVEALIALCAALRVVSTDVLLFGESRHDWEAIIDRQRTQERKARKKRSRCDG